MTTDLTNKKDILKKTPKQKVLSIVKTLLIYGLMFAVIYTAINWWRQPVMPANPQLQLIDYQGQTVDLAALSQEKPTLVYFWGTWCSVCSFTSPTINKLAAENNYPVVTVAIKSGLKDGEMTQGLTGIQPLWSLKLRLWLSSVF